jgi:SPP1 gp7 family putative phage head morphogenesis protein
MADEQAKALELDEAFNAGKAALLDGLRRFLKSNEGFLKNETEEIELLPLSFAEQTEELLVLSFLMGYRHADSNVLLADYAGLKGITFDEAIAFLQARIPLTKDEWDALEPALRFRAFTLANMTQYDLVNDVKEKLIKAVSAGGSLAEFLQDESLYNIAGLNPRQQRPGYWETVYRTNVQTAYNAGRYAQLQDVKPPYYEFVGIGDERQTDICQARSGTLLPADHEFWAANWPPLHFNCRSTVRGVFSREFDQERRAITQERVVNTYGKPQSDFGVSPVASLESLPASMTRRAAEYGILGYIESVRASLLGFEKTPVDYRRVFNVPRNGGFVQVNRAVANEHEYAQNLETAKILAARGDKVRLLPTSRAEGARNADALVNGKLAEFKRLEASSSNAVHNAIRTANKQAKVIVLDLQTDVNQGDFRRGVRQFLFNRTEDSILPDVYLIRNGRVTEINWGDYK